MAPDIGPLNRVLLQSFQDIILCHMSKINCLPHRYLSIGFEYLDSAGDIDLQTTYLYEPMMYERSRTKTKGFGRSFNANSAVVDP